MTDILKLLKSLKTANPERTRKIVKKEWDTNNEEFFVGLQLALDPSLNVKNVPAWDDNDDALGSITMERFHSDMMKIKTGGDPAKIVPALAEMSGSNQWNLWYRKILTKDIVKELPMDIIVEVLGELTKQPVSPQ